MDKPGTASALAAFDDRFPDAASLAAAMGGPASKTRLEATRALIAWLASSPEAAAVLALMPARASRASGLGPSLSELSLHGLEVRPIQGGAGISSRMAAARVGKGLALYDSATGDLLRLEADILPGLVTARWNSSDDGQEHAFPQPTIMDFRSRNDAVNTLLTMGYETIPEGTSEMVYLLDLASMVELIRTLST